jgi:iron(III) transport system substrate-binding protein
MKSRFKVLAPAAMVTALVVSGAAIAQDNAMIEAARSEGAVSIYTSTDLSQADALVDAFKAKYPGIQVEYNDLGTNGTYNRVVSEAAASQMGADIVWSSAMDLQMKLAADGYFEAYKSSEKDAIPGWATYNDLIYATTVEPVGIIYNTRALSEDKVPQTRAELIAFLSDPSVKGKVAAFDPEKSGSGFLFHTNDLHETDNFWEVAKAFGAASGKTYSSTGAMRETVVSGENVLAFNVIGSYALDWIKDVPNLGVAFGKDYTAAFSRMAGIPKGAPHPNAAQLFLDFMLSQEGQSALASRGLPSVRKDVEVGFNIDTIAERVGGALRPIKVDESLLDYLDPAKRVEFLKQWSEAAKG